MQILMFFGHFRWTNFGK